jgi:parallel beta-helix repeat protein
MLAAFVCFFQPVKAYGNTLTVPNDYPTINDAIANATDGDTVLVRQGMYNETIVIDKAITLRGEDTNRTIINGNTSKTVILILHGNVTVTGLTVTYSPYLNAPRRYYQHNWPSDWLGQGGWSGRGYPMDSGVFVRRTEFRLAGIHIQAAKNCNISGNRISDCGVGIWLYLASQNTILGNILVRNDYGLQVDSSKGNSIVGNTFLDNGGGVWLPQPNWVSGWGYNGKTVNNTFTQNNFIGNQKAIEPQCLTNTTNYWDNGSVGNYWDSYNGTGSYHIMGEYYTGGWHQNGVWKEQVYSVDNYPLTEPFNTTIMFAVHEEDPLNEQPPENPSPTDYTIIEVAASIVGILFITALFAYFRKRKNVF